MCTVILRFARPSLFQSLSRPCSHFIAEVLPKAATLRERLRDDQRLEMDGGITVTNAPDCRAAGCDVIAAATAIFGADDWGAAIDGLRGRAAAVERG